MAFALRSSGALRTAPLGNSRAAPRRTCLLVRASFNFNAQEEVPSAGRDWMKTQPGISEPMQFFDPLGLTNSTQFTVDEARRFRESEVTHGRVAMLAALGWVVQEEFHPLFGGDIGGPAFVHFQKVEGKLPQFWEVILLAIGITEAYRISVAYNDPRSAEQLKPEHTPGELGFDPLGLYPKEPKARFEMQTKELNNGRLAMIGVAGFAAQELRDKTTIFKGMGWRGLYPDASAVAGITETAPPAAFPPY